MSRHVPEPWVADQVNWRGEPDDWNWYIHGNAYETTPEDDEDEGDFTPYVVSTSVAIVLGNPSAGDIPRDTAARIVAAVNACAGLTPEQVAAIPRLVAWFTLPDRQVTIDAHNSWVGEWEQLERIFPRREP